MTWSRLDTVSSALSEQIRNASPTEQRRIAIAVARHALLAIAFRHPLVDEVLAGAQAAADGRSAVLPSLDALVETLDEAYFTLAEQEASLPVSPGAVLEAFSRARAVSALAVAIGPSSLEAALESAYEAHAATEDLTGITAIIRSHGRTDGAA